MPIKWDKFKSNMKKYMESFEAETEADLAKKLATEYENAVKTGGDAVYGNAILKGNKKLFEAIFQQAFEGMKVGMPVPSATILMGNASVTYWSGALLKSGAPPAVAKLPPSSTTIVSNTVLVPGAPVPIQLKNSDNYDDFLDGMISSFKKHLLTIGGSTVALVPSPAGPVPTPFPFVGYK